MHSQLKLMAEITKSVESVLLAHITRRLFSTEEINTIIDSTCECILSQRGHFIKALNEDKEFIKEFATIEKQTKMFDDTIELTKNGLKKLIHSSSTAHPQAANTDN